MCHGVSEEMTPLLHSLIHCRYIGVLNLNLSKEKATKLNLCRFGVHNDWVFFCSTGFSVNTWASSAFVRASRGTSGTNKKRHSHWSINRCREYYTPQRAHRFRSVLIHSALSNFTLCYRVSIVFRQIWTDNATFKTLAMFAREHIPFQLPFSRRLLPRMTTLASFVSTEESRLALQNIHAAFLIHCKQ
jgi:hypothetical protein